MKVKIRQELLRQLTEFAKLYPEMRFGQIVCFAAALADDNPLGQPQDADDEAMLDAVKTHLQRRRIPSRGHETEAGAETSANIIRTLEKLGCAHPQWSLGRLVFHLAVLAHANIYDIEDERLLETAQSENPRLDWFDQYAKVLAGQSVIRERRDNPTYRCACCRSRTLYERGGFEICPVCYWLDDGQDDADADVVRGGPNGLLSLTRARENYAWLGACEDQYRDHVRNPRLIETGQ